MLRRLATFLNTNIILGFIPGVILLTCVAVKAEDLTREFVAGMPKNFPPHFYTDPESERPVGFSVDVMDAVAKNSGINIRYEIFENWKETIQAVKDGRVDIIPNIGFTAERKTFADYTPPYETFRINFYIRASSLSLQSVSDIENNKIGVVATNKSRFILEKQGKYNVVITESSEELAWKLISGDIDCIAMPEPVMSYLMQKAGVADQIRVLGNPLIEIKRGIGISKGNTELVKLLSSTLDDFILSQDFKDIYAKWYGAPEPYWSPTRIGTVGAILLFFVLFAIAIWRYRFITKVNKELEITVRERTKKIVESETRLLEAQRMAHFAHWSLDPATGSTIWSEEMYNILGLDPANGSPSLSKHQDFIHPGDWGWFQATVEDTAERGTPFDIILRIVHPDGSLRFINSIGIPSTNDTGTMIELRGTIQDITERTQSEAQLQLVNNALEDSLNAFDIVNADGIFTYVNKAYIDMWGYDNDGEIIGTTTIEHCLDPEQPPRIIHALQTTGKFEGEFTAKRKDGSTFEVFMSSRLAHDPDGNVIYPSSSLDITELMQTRNELRKEKDRLQLALDVVEMGAWDLDLIDHSSRRTFRHDQIFGYNTPLKEWTYPMFLEHVLPEDREEVNCKFTEATANLSNWDFECRIRRPDGEIRWISAVGRHGEPEEGTVRVMVGTVLDITERKQVEKSLNQQQRSIKLWSQIANVFLTSTREDVFADVLDILLKNLESRFGYWGYIDEKGDMVCPSLTRDVWDQCQVPDKSIVFPRDRWGGLWGRSLLERRTIIANENLQIPEGHVALENAIATPIVYNDILIGQFVLANREEPYNKDDQDLLENVAAQTAPILSAILEETKQKAVHQDLENQMRQAQKMEAVGRLAGGVAHDYNNMLSVIIGYSENALENLTEEDSLYDDLTEILSAGKRSADITKQLLAFARQQTTAPIVLDLNECIEGMLKMLRRLIGEDINLAWLPAPNLSMIKIDPAQLDQVLANLCVNARDAISDVGKVTIETKSTRITEEYVQIHPESIAGDFIMLAVSDNGSGISAETIEKIFEPFFTTKGRFEGTGLGLATVHGIVKQNLGFINVYSELGEGTTIKCYLPFHAGESDKEHLIEEGNPALGDGETILLVEDDNSILKLGLKILTKLGYSVIPISDPSKAAQIAPDKLAEIDLLITDVVMPNMNGRQLSTHLQSINPRLKTLYMSGYTANVIAHRGVLDEGIHFIQKPLSKTELSLKVRDVLDKDDSSS